MIEGIKLIYHMRAINVSMPSRIVHNKVCVRLGLRLIIADRINRAKDIASSIIPGPLHRGWNHGFGTNLKYLKLGGIEAMVIGKLHDIVDRLEIIREHGILRGLFGFLGERIATYEPRKLIRNLLDPYAKPSKYKRKAS